MATEGRGDQLDDRRDDAEVPVVVHTCSRLGLQANPPGRRLTLGRWRR